MKRKITKVAALAALCAAVFISAGFIRENEVRADEAVPEQTEAVEPTEAPEPTEAVEPTETPEPTEAVEPTEVPEPTEAPKRDGIEGFVFRLYDVVLGRDPDENGFSEWCEALRTHANNGKDVAYGFLFSREYLGKNVSDEEYITCLYRVFFDREPDESGFGGWLARLGEGKTRLEIFEGFVNSTEWANVCISFGIISGGDGEPTRIPPATDEVRAFVSGFYPVCFGREPDDGGLQSWCNQLMSLKNSGIQVAYGFIFSNEFISRSESMTDVELVTVFYRVFLEREPDDEGLSAWLSVLSKGGGIDDLFRGFAGSREFRAKCDRYGIICGTVPQVRNIARGEPRYSTSWVSVMNSRSEALDASAVRTNIINECRYWYDLQQEGSPNRVRYVFGAKDLNHGSRVDCSGFVTAIVRRAVGTQGPVGTNTYQYDMSYRATWNDRREGLPTRSGEYTLSSTGGRVHIYIDRYGIASGFGMDTRYWEQYLERVGVDSYTWSVRSVDHDNFGYDLDNDGFRPGDLVIWSYANGDTDHIGIYAGDGMVYHILSPGVLYTNITEIRTESWDTITTATIYRMT